MKRYFSQTPEFMRDVETYGFDWLEHVTAVPAPLVLVTGYKANGLTNGTMQSWMAFSNEDGFYCIFTSVNKSGHMYAIARERGQLVINFLSSDVYAKCMSTVAHNGYDEDELALAGLTAQKYDGIDAPIVAECFLSMAAQVVWERELFPGSYHAVLCVKIVGIWMDEEHYDTKRLGRYGDTGYLYNVHNPLNPETGARDETCVATLVKHDLPE